MLGGLVRLILFRVLGARVLLAITVLGWLRKMLGGRRADDSRGTQPARRDQAAATDADRRT